MKSGSKDLRGACASALFQIQGDVGVPQSPSTIYQDAITEPNTSSIKRQRPLQIMLSYQWDSQKRVIQIRDRLVAAGFRVWLDVTNMSTSTALNYQHLYIIESCTPRQKTLNWHSSLVSFPTVPYTIYIQLSCVYFPLLFMLKLKLQSNKIYADWSKRYQRRERLPWLRLYSQQILLSAFGSREGKIFNTSILIATKVKFKAVQLIEK